MSLHMKEVLKRYELGDLVTVYLSSGAKFYGAVMAWVWDEDIFPLMSPHTADEIIAIDVHSIIAVSRGS